MRFAIVALLAGCGSFSPDVEVCAVTCNPADQATTCPRGMSCGDDFHCHEPGDETLCTFDVNVILDNADAFPGAEIVGPGPTRCPSDSCTFKLAGGIKTRFVRDPLSTDFVSFSGGCEGRISCDITPQQDTDVHVTFGAGRTIDVGYLGDGVGPVTSDPGRIDCQGFELGTCVDTFSTSESVELTAEPTSPTIFLGWTGANCGVGPVCTIPPGTDPVAVTGEFEVTRLFVAAVGLKGIADTITPTIDGVQKLDIKTNASREELLAPGSLHTVQLVPTTTIDRKFKEWIGPTCATPLPTDPPDSCTFDMTDDLVVIGVFEPRTLVTLIPQGGAIALSDVDGQIVSCATGTCSAYVDPGTLVTVQAIGASSPRFLMWNSPDTGCTTGPCQFTVTADISVEGLFRRPELRMDTASFTAITYLVFGVINPTTCDTGKLCKETNIPFGSLVTLDARVLPVSWNFCPTTNAEHAQICSFVPVPTDGDYDVAPRPQP